MYTLDSITDHETFDAKGVTITRGDIVRVGDSQITRRVMAISDRWGTRLVRTDGGKQAPSVWTKQFARIVLVQTVAEQDAAAKPARKPRTPKAAPVVNAGEHAALLEVIADAVTAGDSVARNRGIIAASDAGVPRQDIAAAAGLARVGKIIRAARQVVAA